MADRTGATKLILATAHHAAGKLSLTPSWSGAFPDEATLVIYMPGRDFAALAADLMQSGIAAETPCVAVSKATTLAQRSTSTTVERLGLEEIGPAPVLLLIGHAIQI